MGAPVVSLGYSVVSVNARHFRAHFRILANPQV
jgi:hypothetical protein